MNKIEFGNIEEKWRDRWDKSKINEPDLDKSDNPFYNLMMFPYPSAEGLHIGSIYTFSGVDAFGRYQRMKGHQVFEPIGLDGFGIHSENYAIKIGEHISDVSKRTEKHFYEQLKESGNMYSWDRKLETYKPDYYKWTQWLFIELYKRGLAYRKKSKVNWCPTCKTVLADEQVIDGKCERTGDEVEKRDMEQWFFKITDYANRLLNNLSWIDWNEAVKTGQKNWIGKSEGVEVSFDLISESKKESVKIFTTRVDTIFGATFLVIAPENEVISKFKNDIKNYDEVQNYIKAAILKGDLNRTDLNKDKSGIRLEGVNAINPVTGKYIPVYVADYVLMTYGTGSVMGVPAHDDRDYDFAVKYNIEIIPVLLKDASIYRSYIMGASKLEDKDLEALDIKILKTEGSVRMVEIPEASFDKYLDLIADKLDNGFWNEVVGKETTFIFKLNTGEIKRFILNESNKKEIAQLCSEFNGDNISDTSNLWLYLSKNEFYKEIIVNLGANSGEYINSDFINGKSFRDGMALMLEYIEKNDIGKVTTTFKLRDWGVSRQRYWGPPIPMLKNNNGQWKPDKDLPVLLPEIPDFKDILPDGSGKGPLEKQDSFVNYDNEWKRETDVSDPFVDSCWYFFRYAFTEMHDKPFEFVKRPMLGEEVEQNPELIKSLKEIYNIFEAADLYPMITGSLLVTGLNGKSFTKINDLDFAFPNEEKATKAKDILVEKGFEFKSTGKYGNFILEKDTIVIDLGFNWKQDYLGYKISLFDQKFRMINPRLLREYYLKNDSEINKLKVQIIDFWANQRINKWFPVTYYIGGKEHTVLHLLYARFITMVLNDIGYIDFEEPFVKFYGHGLITKDGAKMSKSKGNVINPDEYFALFGVDPVRLYLRFLGPFEQGGDWRDTGMQGMTRFVNKFSEIFEKFVLHAIDFGDGNIKMGKLHKIIKDIGEDYSELRFNTVVAKLMELINWYKENEKTFNKIQTEEILINFLLLIAPMTPYISEELWEKYQISKDPNWKWTKEGSIHNQAFPEFDPSSIEEDQVMIIVQVAGKVRAKIEAARGLEQESVIELISQDPNVQKYIENGYKKVIFVKDKIINFVV